MRSERRPVLCQSKAASKHSLRRSRLSVPHSIRNADRSPHRSWRKFCVSELSRSTWLVTALSPGNGEKISKHVVDGGVAELLDRFAQIQEKARLPTGRSFPIVTIQKAGLDGFWIHRVRKRTGSRVTLWMRLRLLLHVGDGVRRPTRLMVKHWSRHCSRSSEAWSCMRNCQSAEPTGRRSAAHLPGGTGEAC